MLSKWYLLVPCDRVDHLPSRFQEAAAGENGGEQGISSTSDGSWSSHHCSTMHSPPLSPQLAVLMVNAWGPGLPWLLGRLWAAWLPQQGAERMN